MTFTSAAPPSAAKSRASAGRSCASAARSGNPSGNLTSRISVGVSVVRGASGTVVRSGVPASRVPILSGPRLQPKPTHKTTEQNRSHPLELHRCRPRMPCLSYTMHRDAGVSVPSSSGRSSSAALPPQPPDLGQPHDQSEEVRFPRGFAPGGPEAGEDAAVDEQHDDPPPADRPWCGGSRPGPAGSRRSRRPRRWLPCARPGGRTATPGARCRAATMAKVSAKRCSPRRKTSAPSTRNGGRLAARCARLACRKGALTMPRQPAGGARHDGQTLARASRAASAPACPRPWRPPATPAAPTAARRRCGAGRAPTKAGD